MEEQAVSVGDMFDHFLVHTLGACYRGIDTTVVYWRTAGDDVGRNVFGECCASLYHGAATYARLGVLDDGRGVDYTVSDLAIAGNLCAVAHHTLVSDAGVVAHVRTLHEHILAAEHGLSAFVGAAVDDHILTDDVVVAHNDLRRCTLEIEVLRQRGDHSALVYLVVVAHTCAVEDGHEGEDDAVVADFHVVFDIDKGENLASFANASLGRNLGFGADYCVTHNLSVF